MFVLSKFSKNFLANFLGIMAIVAIFGFFLNASLKTPVMEVSVKTGDCLRVIAADGQQIKNGCAHVRKGVITTEHRYVAW